jgi:hypothetical protein
MDKNPKFEYRNPKQFSNSNDQSFETYCFLLLDCMVHFSVLNVVFPSFEIVSNFGFRA